MILENILREHGKALSWRLIASIATIAIAYRATGNWEITGTIGGLDFVIKYFLYIFHERAWRAKW